ncbi:hypothetical protein MMC07_009294 [Pseudocyphellaria aurata]|nr:hypothetical protein [Pseudocyphellaria aurata]
MAKSSDRLRFRDAARSEQHADEQDRLLADDEQQEGASDQDECLPADSLQIYKTIHQIRREIMDVIGQPNSFLSYAQRQNLYARAVADPILSDDPYTAEQLKAPRMNKLLVRPLVDQLYNPNDISVVYCLLVNRVQFLRDQTHYTHRQTVNITRALLCEVLASRVLRRFDEDHPGPKGLLLLAKVLVTGFEPFQGAPEEIIRESNTATHWAVQRIGGYERRLTALEVALVSKSKSFLSSNAFQKVVDGIYQGQIIYTPTTFLNIIPDHYKNKPVSLYDPGNAPLLNQYRLGVPRIRNVMDIIQFMLLLLLYVLVMSNRDGNKFTWSELIFCIYTFGWALEEFASILEHGWQVYTQNLWSFLDFIFCILYVAYLIVRIGDLLTDAELDGHAYTILATAAPILIPRLAFNLMSENILFVSLRTMMANFLVLSVLAVWCFAGFFLAMRWLCDGKHTSITISKWMLWVWFGLDGTGIQRSVELHWLLGPILMVTFAFLGNTLFLTILVSMLTNTFAVIVSDATAERQFQRAVLTFQGVKSDAIFAYQTPFNVVALIVLMPLKMLVTPRWFHKINVTAIRFLNAPILLVIGLYERRTLWAATKQRTLPLGARQKLAFWKVSRFSVHGDLQAVFDTEPPQSVLDQISDDDNLNINILEEELHESRGKRRSERRPVRALSTSSANELTEQLSELLRDHNDQAVKPRLDAMEEAVKRIEGLLTEVSQSRQNGS